MPTTFFATFAQALNEHFATPFSIVELGSGPGRLAAVLLASCKVNSYVAIDFSDAMHVLAREHLGDPANRVQLRPPISEATGTAFSQSMRWLPCRRP